MGGMPISLQERKIISFDILKSVDHFCRNNNIKYYLNYGTLIGAVRHKGFIPWDDDIDIVMFREDYNKFISSFNSEYKDGKYKCLAFEHGDWYMPFAKVVDTRTELFTKEFIPIKDNGIAIDIFAFDYFSDSLDEAVKIKQKLLNKKKYLIYPIYRDIQNIHGSTRNIGKEFVYTMMKKIGWKRWDKLYSRHIKSLPVQNKVYGGNIYFSLGKNLQVVESSIFDETVYLEFEGLLFPAPSQYDKYLTLIYGDYLQLPPEDKRTAHLEQAYYLNNMFAEEIKKRVETIEQ